MRPTLLATMASAMLLLVSPAAAQATCPTTAQSEPLSVTFFGVSTMVLRAGNSAIMVDGFFSRPTVRQTVLNDLNPNNARIGSGLNAARIRRTDRGYTSGEVTLLALLVAQAHHDHSMDAAEVARQTGATLLGSSSTVSIARGDGYTGEVVTLYDGYEECFGPFHLRAILSPHSPGIIPFLVRGSVRGSPPGPRHALAYRDTLNFSFLVTYGRRRILIHPSANHPRRGMGEISADLIFLSTGDLGARSPRFINDYWDAVVARSGARLVVPIHWDDFLHPAPPPPDVEEFFGLPRPRSRPQFDYAVRRIARLAVRDCVEIRFLPAATDVNVESLLAENGRWLADCRPQSEQR